MHQNVADAARRSLHSAPVLKELVPKETRREMRLKATTTSMYRMLSLAFKDVQLVSYPAKDEDLPLRQQMDRSNRILQFLAKVLGRPSP